MRLLQRLHPCWCQPGNERCREKGWKRERHYNEKDNEAKIYTTDLPDKRRLGCKCLQADTVEANAIGKCGGEGERLVQEGSGGCPLEQKHHNCDAEQRQFTIEICENRSKGHTPGVWIVATQKLYVAADVRSSTAINLRPQFVP